MSPELLYVTDPEKWLAQIGHEHELLCVVIFRGEWCAFDKWYCELVSKAKPEGYYMVAWTSEGEEGAKKAKEGWNMEGFDLVVGDKTAALAKYLVEDEILPKLNMDPPRDALKEHYNLSDDAYPEGLVQPGMVVFAHRGNLVMSWEAEYNELNKWGAANRPDPKAIWDEVAHRKKALDHGSAAMPAHGSKLAMVCTVDDVMGKSYTV